MKDLEYWLLNSVVEGGDSIEMLNPEHVESAFNRESHHRTNSEIVDALYHLFQKGDLVAHYMLQPDSKDFIPNPQEIEAALSGEVKISYYLTEQGGALWESISRPDWNRYMTSRGTDSPEGEAISSNVQLLIDYLRQPMFLDSTEAVPGSEVWDVIEPWQATYWKILPLGHRVRYQCRPVYETPDDSNIPEWEIKWQQAADYWRNIQKWYTSYLDISAKES